MINRLPFHTRRYWGWSYHLVQLAYGVTSVLWAARMPEGILVVGVFFLWAIGAAGLHQAEYWVEKCSQESQAHWETLRKWATTLEFKHSLEDVGATPQNVHTAMRN